MGERMSIGRRLLDGWMAIVARFGSAQTTLLLVLFYGVLIGPVGLAMAIGRSDPLGRRNCDGSAWSDADTAKPDLERAKLTS